MRRFFEPAAAPAWLKPLLSSIRAALGDVWDVPLRPFQADAADLPAAADYRGALAWNATALTITWSDGTGWKTPQASDPRLDAIAGLAPAADQVAYWTGAASAALTGLTAFGRSLIDGADAAAARATLGLGSAAVQNVGTSGAVVPLLNGANGWSAGQSIARADGGSAFALTVTHNGGTVGRMGLKVVTTGTSTTTDALRVDTGAASIGTGAFVVLGSGHITATGQLAPGSVTATGAVSNAISAPCAFVDYQSGTGVARLGGFNFATSAWVDTHLIGLTLVLRANNVTIATVQSGGLNLASGKTLSVNGTQVVAARRTGWSAATGTATRTGFDTATVTTAQLAERVKALIDDLHGSAGHGLIGT